MTHLPRRTCIQSWRRRPGSAAAWSPAPPSSVLHCLPAMPQGLPHFRGFTIVRIIAIQSKGVFIYFFFILEALQIWKYNTIYWVTTTGINDTWALLCYIYKKVIELYSSNKLYLTVSLRLTGVHVDRWKVKTWEFRIMRV